MRPTLPVLLLAPCLACTHGPPPPAASTPAGPGSPEAAARVTALAEEYFEGKLRLDPLLATQVGDARYDDRLPDDLTDAGREERRQLALRTRAALEGIARTDLRGEDVLTWAVLDDLTRTTLEALPLDDSLMPLEQMNSLPVQLPVLGSGTGQHPFRTVADYEHFLSRIRAFPTWVDAAIARTREGITRGITRPRPVVLRMLPQLEAQVVVRAEESIFWGPVSRMPASFSTADRQRLTAAYREAITGTLVPTYRRLADFVRSTVLPSARTTTAIEALPDGPARYALAVRKQTTTRLDAQAIHRLGLDEVERIRGELDGLRIAERFDGTPAQFLESISADPTGAVRSEQELVEGYLAIKARVRPRLPELFGRLPAADFEVRPVERFREQAAASQYVPATPDGSRPGVFYANAGALRTRPVRPSESLFLHEALPGHHFQVTLASENQALPRVRRFALYNAYVEGWALYAERLGAQLGLYQDVRQRVGQLRSELFRAVRLVVDTGLHHEGWSRDRALTYARTTMGRSDAGLELEIDRYLADPGQALGYKMGEIAIRRMREEAERRLGSAFDLRAFHDAVLESGPLPLDVLEEKMRAWTPHPR
ncbi:MAG TPA: DUF885 domain-containing protein [Myxococcaceae bacterium]|nr:DUF885 domain-containing protein [Myxococcaceae bacterium]